jgi:hypothetical protein
MAIKKVVRGKGAGNVLAPQDIGADMKALAELVKQFMITTAQAGRNHKLLAKGGFVQSVAVEPSYDGFNIKVAEQAQYMDSGRKPGGKKVPIAALIAWIKRYRVGQRDKKTGKFKKRLISINSIAFAIQTAIYKKGIKPSPFIKDTLAFAEDLMKNYIDETLIPDILTSVEFILK